MSGSSGCIIINTIFQERWQREGDQGEIGSERERERQREREKERERDREREIKRDRKLS